MTSEVAKVEPNYFEQFGDASTPRTWLGDLMRFSKFGEYIAGVEGAEVESGTELIALMSLLETGWQCWRDSRPVGQRMGRIAEGFVPPRRSELGDLDQSTWEQFDDGRAKDPWVLSNFLPLATPKAKIYTFVTPSKGGLGAIGELSKQYGRHLRQAPDEYPIVKLDVGSYQHSNRAFGEIRFPILEVVGWTALPKAVAEATGATGGNTPTAAATAKLAPPAETVSRPVHAKSRAEASKPTPTPKTNNKPKARAGMRLG